MNFPVFEPMPLPPYRTFLTPIPTLQVVRPRVMRILGPVAFVDSLGYVWRVPAGWCSDGASIPWIAQCCFDPWDPLTLRSALLHDCRFCVHDLSFSQSNRLFREGLEAEGWPFSRLFHAAVGSPFGWWSYHFTPDLPENREQIAAMQAAYDASGPEKWRPETQP